jgi:hypothetical protein
MPTSRAFDKGKSVDGLRQDLLRLNSLAPHQSLFEAQFASFATTIQQRIDTDSGGNQTLSGSLSAQVERAVSQAMRRGNIALAGGPGNAYGSGYGTAYGGSYGTAYSVNSGSGYGGGYGGMPGNPGVAQPAMAAGPRAVSAVQLLPVELPPPQAVLASEAVIAQNDLLAALDALQPLSVLSDPGDIAAYKDIIRAEVVALTAEFARADLPRPARVRVLLGALLGWAFPVDQTHTPPLVTAGFQTGDVAALLFLLNLGQPLVASSFVDQQDALQQVVASAATRLFELWVQYEYSDTAHLPPAIWLGVGDRLEGVGGSAAVGAPQLPGDPRVIPATVTGTYSQRIIIANELLPVLSQDTQQVAGALDAIGFGPGPQETTPVNGLLSLVDGDLFTVADLTDRTNQIPETQQVLAAQSDALGPTVKDLLDWASDLSGPVGLDAIRQCGQLGLNLLADQADELFFIIEAVLLGKEATVGVPELFDPQVKLELRSLARDLSELADQGI